jgi:hypothetical protein
MIQQMLMNKKPIRRKNKKDGDDTGLEESQAAMLIAFQ